jgi:hypothetical protein
MRKVNGQDEVAVDSNESGTVGCQYHDELRHNTRLSRSTRMDHTHLAYEFQGCGTMTVIQCLFYTSKVLTHAHNSVLKRCFRISARAKFKVQFCPICAR